VTYTALLCDVAKDGIHARPVSGSLRKRACAAARSRSLTNCIADYRGIDLHIEESASPRQVATRDPQAWRHWNYS